MSVTSEEILLNLKSYIIGHSQFFNQHPLTEFPFIIDGRQGEQSLKLAFSFEAPKVDGSGRITSCAVQRLWNHTNDEWGLDDMENIVVLVDLSDSASIQLVYHLVEALSACEDLSGGNRAQAVKVKSVHVVDFDPLAEYYPFLCGSLNDLASCYPTEVFSNLYLSGKGPAREGRVMTHLGITHVVNAASFNFPNHFAEKGIEYLRLSIVDDESQDLEGAFEKALPFLQKARSTGGHVLVHCNQGINRSAAMIVAHLISSAGEYHGDLEGALQHVRACRRPTSCLTNTSFVKQLEALAQESYY